jgi:hypothetical protein
MRILGLVALIASVTGLAWADSVPPCPATVTSCTFTTSPGTTGSYSVGFSQNPTPFWQTDPVSGWPPVFKSILTPSELASGQVPYNVEYDFIVGIELSNNPGASGQVTVDFTLPTSLTNWVVVGYPDPLGGNNASVLTASGGSTGAGVFGLGSGSAYVLTATPGQLIVTGTYNAGNVGDTEFTGMLIGETVPEPQTGWLVLVGAFIAACITLTRRQRAL